MKHFFSLKNALYMLHYQIVYTFKSNDFYAMKWCGIRNGRRGVGRPSRKKLYNFCSYYVSLYKFVLCGLLFNFFYLQLYLLFLKHIFIL